MFVFVVFGDCDVDFLLETNSAEVNLFYFSIFSIFRMFLAFKNFYLILKFRFAPRFVLKNITFGQRLPRSRYRKIPPAAVANQIAGKARIPSAHEQKKIMLYYLLKIVVIVNYNFIQNMILYKSEKSRYDSISGDQYTLNDCSRGK